MAPTKLATHNMESVRLAVARLINHAAPETYAAQMIIALAATHPQAGNMLTLLNENPRRRRTKRRLTYATGAK